MRTMIKKSICIVVYAFLTFVVVSAQTGYLPPNPITAPTVSAPAMAPMPTVNLPTVSTPTMTGPGTTSGNTTLAPASTSSTSTGTSSSSSSSSAATSTTGSTATSALSLLGLGSNSSLLNALNGTGSDDSSASALSSLLGTGTSSTTTDSATLSKILELLEKQQAQADATAKAGTSAATVKATEKSAISSGGELIRFTVNGYSITASTTTLVSSILAKDGSFLLTGDRVYVSSGQKLTETFYLLCRKNTDGTYRLQADVSQNPVNANSFLYQLARRSPIKGTLTGDLLVFRTADPAWTLNLVIRIISPSVVKTTVR